MQKIQPKLKRIQERFKDDRQLMQQKMMELYRKEGVNPMGGCLPMLVQLPILILIWRAILHSGELIHLSPSFLWVADLMARTDKEQPALAGGDSDPDAGGEDGGDAQ